MGWQDLRREVQYLAMHNPPPRVLLLHVGSNDLGTVGCSVMRAQFKADILDLHALFPDTTLVVSAMLPRLDWSRSLIPINKLERKRRLLNRFLRRLALYVGGRFIAHEDITYDCPGLFYSDGVHLSDVGSDLFLLSIRTVLEELC